MTIQTQVLKPVVTIVGGQRTLDSICKLLITNSIDQRMDYESVDFSQNFETRAEYKTFGKELPEGILNLQWTHKRRKLLPACILMVFDWSGAGINNPSLDSPDWKHKENLILKKLRKFKDQCKGRLVKFGIICFLGSSNEDISVDEKLSLLKKSGEIDSKSILLLKYKLEESDHLLKFKKFLWDACISHYKDEIDRLKRIKSKAHKELSGGFLELQIRYNFKLGYYSELRQDKDSALVFYKKSYKELQESNLNPAIKFEEKKAVADVIVHRLQCLLLSSPHLLAKLKEAISTFKTHISVYRAAKNKNTVNFEVWKWLSEHFSRFGGLLEKVPNEIYEKDNYWTHPGFYFKVAGIFYMVRMTLTVDNADFMQSVQNWQGFISNAGLRVKDPVYIGQPKLLASHPLQKDMIEGISNTDQANIIKILEESEITHLPITIEYLFNSLKFYKETVVMNRVSLFLIFLLGQLYKKKGENDTNYLYNSEIVQKMNGWNAVQSSALEDLIKTAEETKKTNDLLQWTLKALEISKGDKVEMFEKINCILKNNLAQVKAQGMINIKAKFESKTVTAYSSVKLFLHLTNTLPCDLTPVKLSLCFSDSSFNCDLPEIYSLSASEILTLSHSVVIKNPNMSVLVLLKVIARYEPVGLSWVDFELESKAKLKIVTPGPQLSPRFNHLPPALIGEYYILNISLHPYSKISSVKMIIFEDSKDSMMRSRSASIDRDFDCNYCIFDEDGKIVENGVSIDEVSLSHVVPLKIIFYEEKNYFLKVRLNYQVSMPHDIVYKCDDQYDLEISVQPPFQFKTLWQGIIECGVPNLMNLKIWNICQAPIYIHKITVLPENYWVCNNSVLTFDELEVKEGVIISNNFIAVTTVDAQCSLTGYVLVTWSRKNGVVNDCRIPITVVVSQYFPIDLNVEVGSEFIYGQIFSMTARIKNKTNLSLEAKLVVEESAYFLFGGVENVKFDLAANEVKEFCFSLIGVSPGYYNLPVIRVVMQEVQKAWQGKAMILP